MTINFDPEKSLFELPPVRWTAGITLVAATLLTILIAYNSKPPLKLDYEGFNNAIEIFRFPIGLFALGVSIIGICGANHRSEQTKRQIERTRGLC